MSNLYKKVFAFGTKAETLFRIKTKLKKSSIPEFIFFPVSDWKQKREAVLREIQVTFPQNRLIIRSSASSEDGSTQALPGIHDSIADIFSSNNAALADAIDKVCDSYKSRSDERDHILVQVMVTNASMSGVVFTQDMNTGAPYYVINYDDETGKTDTVTGGGAYSNRTLYVQRAAINELRSDRFRNLLDAVKEIEFITGKQALDIEFAVGPKSEVWLLQVRQITTHPNWNRRITVAIVDAIDRTKEFVNDRVKPQAGILGHRSLFGQMPDWNPAEMIGAAPRPLAISLYRKLITDSSWRIARRKMGYKEPRGSPLMYSLVGRPYIDVRLSFQSFLPRQLSDSIGEKLVNAWLDRLALNKELHDKVEFEVAITSLDFDFENTLNSRYSTVLSRDDKAEFRKCLHQLTDSLVSGKCASIQRELKKVNALSQRRAMLDKHFDSTSLCTVNALLEDCVELGTIPFSILARHGFIAKSFLRSLVSRKAISEESSQLFQSSIVTIAGELISDIHNVLDKKITQDEFMFRYGHLRPGTYDILSMRYDQRDDFFNGLRKPRLECKASKFEFPSDEIKSIESMIKENGFTFSADTFIQYLRDAISGREYAKFVFTKNISDSLELIAKWGETIGLSREELSFLKIEDILDARSTAKGRSLEHYLRNRSDLGASEYEITRAIQLPQLIEKPEDASIIPLLLNRPNFITNKYVRSQSVLLDGHGNSSEPLKGKVVLIESADPGFDWIFSHQIAGLVTKFGGTNSHMAIRCAEFGLPAAIGCGEQIFNRLIRSSGEIEIDCASGRVTPAEEQ